MILRRWALLCCFLAAMAHSNGVRAGAWGMDPVLSLLGDYSTDPALLHQEGTAAGSGALQLDAPTTYDEDRFKLFVQPSFRVGDSKGYSSVASDYEHLNVKGEFDDERNTLSASAGVARDSSLTYNFLTSGSVGVRRDSETADLNWDRHLTELIEFDADANWQRVLFGEPAGVATLIDYKYGSIAPALSWSPSERGKLTLVGTVGRYDSLGSRDGSGLPTSTESRSANLEFGFVGQLSELWTLTALGGYSRALNQIEGIQNQCIQSIMFGPFEICIHTQPVLATLDSSQSGSVYSLNLTHQGDQLTLNVTASRQLAATGFAFLSRQDTYELKANYTLSERWSFTGDVRAQRYQNPPASGAADVNVKYLGLSANWGWTEHWTVTLSAARVSETVQLPHYTVASNEVTLSLSHRFNHLNFQ
jgi:hypothetical protein